MREEIQAPKKHNTSALQDLPNRKKPISCKWVYWVKYPSDGTIQWYKEHLVIRDGHQVEGLDYNKTFAPVAKMCNVRRFLSAAMSKDWELHQLDINNAFLVW